MSEIRFYNYEFEPLVIETDIISLYETVYYNKIGVFEARLSPFSKAFARIAEEPYVLAEEGGRLFAVTAKQAGEVCTVYGRTPNWFLSKRIAEPFTSKRLYEVGDIPAKNAEEVVRYLISKYFGADDGNFLLTDRVGLTSELDFRQIVLNPLSEVVIDCLDSAGAGHEVYYDKKLKRWIFNILKGQETETVIGEAQRNTISSEYTDNALGFANCGIYEKSFEEMGDWDAQTNTPSLLEISPESYGKRYYVANGGTQFGITFARGEYASYARADGKIGVTDAERGYLAAVYNDSAATGLYRWYDSLEARSEDIAKNELSGKKWEKTVEAETDGLKLGEDYKLGDIVRVQKKIGNSYITSKKRIIGTEFRQERGAVSEKIIFGEVT